MKKKTPRNFPKPLGHAATCMLVLNIPPRLRKRACACAQADSRALAMAPTKRPHCRSGRRWHCQSEIPTPGSSRALPLAHALALLAAAVGCGGAFACADLLACPTPMSHGWRHSSFITSFITIMPAHVIEVVSYHIRSYCSYTRVCRDRLGV